MGSGNADDALKLMHGAVGNASRTYYFGSLIGYFLAIIVTVIVMLVFDHGQPALLYLVPGVLGSVLVNAFRQGEFKQLWEFNEEKILGKSQEEKDK